MAKPKHKHVVDAKKRSERKRKQITQWRHLPVSVCNAATYGSFDGRLVYWSEIKGAHSEKDKAEKWDYGFDKRNKIGRQAKKTIVVRLVVRNAEKNVV